MTSKKIKWGIIGLGAISHDFVKDLLLVDEAELYAVASRNKDKASEFAALYGVNKSYDSYDALFKDETVDIIYIATPHHLHASLSIQAIQKGKHVLCEKPMTINSEQAIRVMKNATNKNVFFMEALWSRFNPGIQKVLQLVKDGELGTINYLNADFSFWTKRDMTSRLFDMNLAGGALLDIGIYPLFLSYIILGNPLEINALAHLDKGGVDVQTAMLLKYENAMANLFCGFMSDSDMIARIYGTEGSIFIPKDWYKSQGFTLVKNGEKQYFDLPTRGTGFYYEILECHKCIAEGKIQSELWSHQNSMELMQLMDDIRNMINLKYPFE